MYKYLIVRLNCPDTKKSFVLEPTYFTIGKYFFKDPSAPCDSVSFVSFVVVAPFVPFESILPVKLVVLDKSCMFMLNVSFWVLKG